MLGETSAEHDQLLPDVVSVRRSVRERAGDAVGIGGRTVRLVGVAYGCSRGVL